MDANSVIFGVWFLIGAALVFWMQAGFAMVEAGFTRAKNAGNIIMKNLMDFCIGTVMFILIGFSLLLGEDFVGLIGKPGFDIITSYKDFDWSSFVFNLVFCATTATIVSGAMAERTKFIIILYLFSSDFRIYLSGRSTLDLGRRLVIPVRFPRLRRIMCNPYGRWYLSIDRCSNPRTSYW